MRLLVALLLLLLTACWADTTDGTDLRARLKQKKEEAEKRAAEALDPARGLLAKRKQEAAERKAARKAAGDLARTAKDAGLAGVDGLDIVGDTDYHGFLAANVVAFDADGPPCEGEGSSIGGSPACFTIGDTTEMYLCDGDGKTIFIAECRKEDCTECEFPEVNKYGYENNKCQSNGWLRAECTDRRVAVSRFL